MNEFTLKKSSQRWQKNNICQQRFPNMSWWGWIFSEGAFSWNIEASMQSQYIDIAHGGVSSRARQNCLWIFCWFPYYKHQTVSVHGFSAIPAPTSHMIMCDHTPAHHIFGKKNPAKWTCGHVTHVLTKKVFYACTHMHISKDPSTPNCTKITSPRHVRAH